MVQKKHNEKHKKQTTRLWGNDINIKEDQQLLWNDLLEICRY